MTGGVNFKLLTHKGAVHAWFHKAFLTAIFENTSLAAPGALAHRLQRRTACNAAPRASGPQNGRRGLERCLPLGFGALPSTFAK